MSPFPPRPRPCKHCRSPFVPVRPFQAVCGPVCAVRLVKAEKAAEKAGIRTRKEAIKTIPVLISEAQKAFNAYIRERDRDKPCICCGKPLVQSDEIRTHSIDAGHYRSVGSAPHLRFDERNCHAQDVQCNRWGAGRAVDYRIGLVRRIGLPAVEALEADNGIHKWTKDELREIRASYAAKLKQLKKEHA